METTRDPRIDTELDYINYPKFKNSINCLIKKYPNGVETNTIAKALMITPEEVEKIYQSAVKKLRKILI